MNILPRILLGVVLVGALAVAATGVGITLGAFRGGDRYAVSAPGTPPPTVPSPDPDPRAAPPAVLPTPQPPGPSWPARSAADVALHIAQDRTVLDTLPNLTRPGSPVFDQRASAPLTLGTPVFVRALLPSDFDVWIVPVNAGPDAIAIYVARVFPDSTAAVGLFRTWQGRFPHLVPTGEAIARGSTANDPVVKAELMWAVVPPTRCGPADSGHPFYQLTRKSGFALYLFQAGHLVDASNVILDMTQDSRPCSAS